MSLHASVGATAMGEALHTGRDVSGPQRLIRPGLMGSDTGWGILLGSSDSPGQQVELTV